MGCTRAILSAVAFTLVAALPAPGAERSQPADTHEEFLHRVPSGGAISVGVGTLLTGTEAILGREVLNGAQAFVHDNPAIKGHPLTLVPLDDGCDPLVTAESATAFCSMKPPVVAVLGYLCTPGTLKALEIHEHCRLPLLNVSSADPRLTQRGSPWILRLWFSRSRHGLLVAQWIRRRRLRRVLLVHETDSTSRAIALQFQEAVDKLSRRTKIQMIPLDELVWEELKISPQLVYYVGEGMALGTLWRGSPAKVMSAAWILDGRVDTQSWQSENVTKPKEVYRVALRLPTGDPDTPQYQYFRGRFGEPGVYTLVAYDAMTVLADAIGRVAQAAADDITWQPTKLMKALRETQVQGLTGPISFDERGERLAVGGQVLRWRNETWQPLWQGSVP